MNRLNLLCIVKVILFEPRYFLNVFNTKCSCEIYLTLLCFQKVVIQSVYQEERN